MSRYPIAIGGRPSVTGVPMPDNPPPFAERLPLVQAMANGGVMDPLGPARTQVARLYNQPLRMPKAPLMVPRGALGLVYVPLFPFSVEDIVQKAVKAAGHDLQVSLSPEMREVCDQEPAKWTQMGYFWIMADDWGEEQMCLAQWVHFLEQAVVHDGSLWTHLDRDMAFPALVGREGRVAVFCRRARTINLAFRAMESDGYKTMTVTRAIGVYTGDTPQW